MILIQMKKRSYNINQTQQTTITIKHFKNDKDKGIRILSCSIFPLSSLLFQIIIYLFSDYLAVSPITYFPIYNPVSIKLYKKESATQIFKSSQSYTPFKYCILIQQICIGKLQKQQMHNYYTKLAEMITVIESEQKDPNPAVPNKIKSIHKSKIQRFRSEKKAPIVSFAKVNKKKAVKNQFIQSKLMQLQSAGSWLQHTSQWINFQEGAISGCIKEQLQQLPSLPSIEQLFSIASAIQLTQEVQIDHLQRYSKIVAFVDHEDGSRMIMNNKEAAVLLNVCKDRQTNGMIEKMLSLSIEEGELVQKRWSFMEKIKENEAKYDSSIRRMSQISKELAFTYRIYLEKRSQVTDFLSSIQSKDNRNSISQNSFYEEYTRIMIRKTLEKAFLRTSIDPLNYFKHKEHLEAERSESYHHISHIQELQKFIDRRRPKRGRKLLLATACSVCFSDHHEMSNPLAACCVCGLRAHKSCYSFSQVKCGHCVYQKLERQKKERIPQCFICKQRGLMLVRLNDSEFSHAFCLLIHGYWKLSTPSIDSVQTSSIHNQSSRVGQVPVLQSKFRNFFRQIEFMNPNHSTTSVSLPAIDSTIYNSQLQVIAQDSFDHCQSLGFVGLQREVEEVQIREYKSLQKNQNCACCGQLLFKNCYASCINCNQDYHGFCAFFSGFDLTLPSANWSPELEGSLIINCCCKDNGEIAWNRKYKLNFGRIAFNFEAAFPHGQRDPMNIQSDHSLFNH